MNNEPDDKPLSETSASEQPTKTVLRLVPRAERERAPDHPREARRPGRHPIHRSIRDRDDDDPGPSAA
jgi:hypothetical protein